jgi:hypothetical protein
MADYVSHSDPELAAWLYNFITKIDTYSVDLGLAAPDILPVTTGYNAFNTSLTTYNAEKIVLATASSDRKTKRVDVVDDLRPLVRRIQNHPAMTDAMRSDLGLPIRGSGQMTAGAMPPDIPKIYLEAEPGTVWVHFGTEPANERINGKPVGVKGCNIWRKKASDLQYSLVAYQTASPYEDTIAGEGSDYTYVAQYRGNNAKDVGQSSIAGTIAARGALVA